jgi:hypothetical protein
VRAVLEKAEALAGPDDLVAEVRTCSDALAETSGRLLGEVREAVGLPVGTPHPKLIARLRALADTTPAPRREQLAETIDPRRDRWVTWTTASPHGVDDRHRGVFVAEHRGIADVVEDEGSPRCIPLSALTFEEDCRG